MTIELIKKAHEALRAEVIWDNEYGWSEPTPADREKIINALMSAGLLADPAQTTELERLRKDVEGYQNQSISASATAKKRLELLNEARAEVERLNLEIQGHQTNDGYDKGWEHGSAAGRAWKRERDELQARITDALDKLKVVDNLIVDWQPSLEEWARCVSLIIHVRAALAGDEDQQK